MTALKTLFAALVLSVGFLFTLQAPVGNSVVITFAKIKKTLGIQLPAMDNLQIETLPFDHSMGECRIQGRFDHLSIIGFRNSEMEIANLTPHGVNFITKTPKIDVKGNYSLKVEKCDDQFDGEKSGGFDFQIFDLYLNVGANLSADGEPKKIINLDLTWTVKNISLTADNLFSEDERGRALTLMMNNYGTSFLNMVPLEAKHKFQDKVKLELNNYFAAQKPHHKSK